ncbi:condensation domain-containing protein, partial [Salinactinospora qingdaonensis]|uniref:condensation domain-containing protein n=1 Tax=Salinactinospora qingdaonensis TaxID=702744 RepID=UPI0031E70D62
MVRVVVFDGGVGGGVRLVVVAHHLVVDGVSWRVLVEDFARAYGQVMAGEPVDLGARTTPFPVWAERLAAHVQAGGFDAELDHWRRMGEVDCAELPRDREHEGNGLVASQGSVSVGVSGEVTAALVREVAGVVRARVDEVLLAVVGRVVCGWVGGRVVVDVEGHGREELFAGVDVSRTVGWFTSVFPVVVADAGEWSDQVRGVKEAVRAVPHRGVGFGALRYLGSPEQREVVAGVPAAQVSFNYLGRFDTTTDHHTPYTAMTLGGSDAPEEERAHLLDIVGRIEDGRLIIEIAYSRDIHTESTIRRLADHLRDSLEELVGLGVSGGVSAVSPSDFALVELEQAAVDRVVGDGAGVVDVLPLTPMQQGMLFHSLLDGGSSYFEQLVVELDGVADVAALGRAWQRVVDERPALRVSLAWEELAEPVQVVHREVTVPVRVLDWRGCSVEWREQELARLVAEDEAAGLDLGRAPLLRVVLARVDETRVVVVWTFHHVLLDGWSLPLVLEDVFAAYRGRALKPRPSFRGHLEWLSERDTEAGLAHWREVLAGFDTPTPLPYDRTPRNLRQARSTQRLETPLSEENSAAVHRFAREQGVTVNAVVQGAWALLLAAYSGETDVVFGATTSGRPAELPGVEEALGLFINTLPVRVSIDPATPAATWL